jgi:hypothetical protein
MITVSETTKNLIKKGNAITTSAGAEFEYNLNSMVEYIKPTSSALTNAFGPAFKKLFPIDTIYKPFRPLSPGIKYLVHTTGNTDTPVDSFERPRNPLMGDLPRLYYPGPDVVYKYWLAPKNTNINISLEYFSDEAKTVAKLVPANKIIARFETNHDTPISWVISVVKEDNSVVNVPGTELENGEATIYFNGTTWSTEKPTLYTTTQKLKKISLSAVNSNTGKFLGVIELSPRWVVFADSDVVSFFINKETTADDTSIVPVGTITANYLNLSILKHHADNSKQIVEYNIKNDIDDTKFYLFKNTSIKPYINIGDEVSSEKVVQGTFYVNSWTLSEFGAASIDATDSAKILQDTLCPQILVQDSPVTSVIKRVLDSIGFSNYKINIKLIDEKVTDIPSLTFWWCDGDKTVWEVLQELCRDIQMNAFVDENNILNFYSRNFIYDTTVTSKWIFTDKEIKSGNDLVYAPNIVNLTSREILSANQVRVRYSTAFSSVNSQSSSPLWKSSESYLGAGSLETDIINESTKFQVSPNTVNSARNDKVFDSFNGYVLINGEIIEYDGLWYQYVPSYIDPSNPSAPGKAIPKLIKSQSDIWKWSSSAKPGYKNFYPTGEYNIKTRAALGTSKSNHPKSLDSYINGENESDANKFNKYKITLATPDVAKLKVGVGTVNAPARTDGETISKGFLMLSNLDKDKKTFDAVMKEFKSISSESPSYLACGTRMFFDSQFQSPAQVGGMGFCLDSTGKNGYYVLIRTTAFAGLQKDIMVVKISNNKLTVLKDSQQTSTKTLSGIYSGSSYNIDALVKRESTGEGIFKNTITLFINGFKITAVDPGLDSFAGYTPPTTITKNVGLFCGQGISYFEFLYAKSITEDLYEKNNSASVYRHDGAFSDDTISMLYGDLIYNNANTIPDQSGPMFEFGKTVREIRKVKISYDDRPALPISFKTSNNKYATVLSQRIQPFTAETYVLNNTSTSVILDDSNNTSFYVLGNSIQRSGIIDYDTDKSDDSKSKEPVIFDSSWIQSEEDAEGLANWIKDTALNKGRAVEITAFGNPILSAGDIVSISYPILGMSASTDKYIITRCELDYTEGVNTKISCRAI